MPRISWKLGRVFGIDLFLHPSALLVLFLVAGKFAFGLETFAIVVALFGSIVLHELGHALMARRYGIGTEDITLYLFGGVARLHRMPRSAGPELLIALAGPAVNLAIVGALLVAIRLGHLIDFDSNLLEFLLELNLGLALFNLLPIFPMDGGRVIRALLSGWLGRTRATQVAASLGQMIAVVGGVAFLILGKWDLVVLSVFVYYAAGVELRQVLREGGSGRFTPFGGDAATTPPTGFRWSNQGNGVWRLVPIMVQSSGRNQSWS